MSWPWHPRTATMSRPNQRGYAVAARSRGPSTVAAVIVAVVVALLALAGCTGPVSYTHLTLPTSDLV